MAGSKKLTVFNWRAVCPTILSVIKIIKWPFTLVVIIYLIVSVPGHTGGMRVNWDLLLRYVDVIIWPLVVIGTVWFIKPDLPALLGRLEELNLLGNNAKFTKKQNQITETQADELKAIASDAPSATTKTATDFQVADDETHNLLTSYDAAVAYAQVYEDIFGTQIRVLRTLLDYKSGLKPTQLSSLLEEHMRLSNGKGYSDIVSFMQFLLRNTLVIHDPKTQIYQLTNAGYYFLVYLYKTEQLDKPKLW